VTVHDFNSNSFSWQLFLGALKGEIKWQMQRFALKRARRDFNGLGVIKKDIQKYVGARESKIHVVYLAAGEQFERIKTEDIKLKEIRKKFGLPEKV